MAGPTSTRDRDFTMSTDVVGLKELRAELRAANPAFAKRLQVVNKTLVTRIAEKAQSRVYSSVDAVSPSIRTGPKRSRPSKFGLSKARDSIRGNASGTEARVVAGGPKSPSFFGFEFGGSRGLAGPGRPETSALGRKVAAGGRMQRSLVRVRTRQFPVHKGKEGYFLYPTVREAMPTAFEDWSNIFDEVMATEGPA